MMIEIDKIALIKIENGQILNKRTKGKNKYYKKKKKRENNETDEQTLIREIQEELSVDIIPESIEYIGTFKAQSDGDAKGIMVKMTCYKADYIGTPKESSEIAEIKWLNFTDLNIISEVDKIIFKHLKENRLLV